MSYSATRLTIYSIISAIETDLRDLICATFHTSQNIPATLGESLFAKCYERLQKDAGPSAFVKSIGEVAIYLDYADSYQFLNSASSALAPGIAQSLKELTPTFDVLAPIRNRVAHSRPLNFEDLAIALDSAEAISAHTCIPWLNLKQVREKLRTNPEFVLSQVIPASPIMEVSNNLPIPDFDETGFIGRETQVRQLISLIKGPYPVISVIGEGGLGKTAIALKVAYEIVEDFASGFDSVVWTTAKTATITAQEIVRIESAITSSLGMFNAITQELAGTTPMEPVDEILSYLNEFKILLILDNLETVIDKRLYTFLERLPNGSKVLITSRIGLGEFERRLKLDPLNDRESTQLLRSLSKMRNLESLARSSNDLLKRYCTRMKHNPGFIKWFVAAVQAGSRPEQILDQPTLFLEYCMSNVYGHLTPESKRILKSMQSIPSALGQAEMTFLNDMDTLTVQTALYQLLATNMVLMRNVGAGQATETKYILSDLARDYLLKKHPVSKPDYTHYRNKQLELERAGNFIRAETNAYSIFSITARSKGDLIVAKHLLDALKATQGDRLADRLPEARASLNKARALAPHYFEVHRVDAWINARAGNIPAAETAYELAVELEPKSAPLRYWYAGFVFRLVKDSEKALEHYQTAKSLDPKEPQIQLEMARVLMAMHRYEEASSLLVALCNTAKLIPWLKRKAFDLELQMLQRHADYCCKHHDPNKAFTLLVQFHVLFSNSSSEVRDSHVVDTLLRALSLSKRVAILTQDPESKVKTNDLVHAIESDVKRMGVEPGFNIISAERFTGVVDRIPDGKKFGFIRTNDGREFFFHFGAFLNNARPDLLQKGDQVRFVPGTSPEGLTANYCEVVISELG